VSTRQAAPGLIHAIIGEKTWLPVSDYFDGDDFSSFYMLGLLDCAERALPQNLSYNVTIDFFTFLIRIRLNERFMVARFVWSAVRMNAC
jgi:hypothetical protein